MPQAEIWNLPAVNDDPGSNLLQDISRPHRGRIYYTKSSVDVVGELDYEDRVATEWQIPPSLRPAYAAPDTAGGSQMRLSVGPGQTPPLWVALDGWDALLRLEPATNRLEVFSGIAEAGPFHGLRTVHVERADRIWFAAKDSEAGQPVIGVLAPADLRASLWRVPGVSDAFRVADLWVDGRGRAWFTLYTSTERSEIPFLGVLDPAARRATCWIASDMDPSTPSHYSGSRRLAARARGAGAQLWLGLYLDLDVYSVTMRFDTATGEFLVRTGPAYDYAIQSSSVAWAAAGDGLRRLHVGSGCFGARSYSRRSGVARAQGRDVHLAAEKPTPRREKIRPERVELAEVVSDCQRDLSGDDAYFCHLVRRGSDGEIFFAREQKNSIERLIP